MLDPAKRARAGSGRASALALASGDVGGVGGRGCGRRRLGRRGKAGAASGYVGGGLGSLKEIK
jgi:hypothetical protein